MEQTIYLGPSVKPLGLLRNQVYLHGLPGEVQAAIATYPEVQELIVPIEELSTAKLKMDTPGEHLHHVRKEFLRKAGVR